jgi:hypothetical protein
MHAAVRPYVTGGVALVGASVIAVSPIAPRSTENPIVNLATRLTAASVANIIPNLLIDIANIPYNELQALGNGNVTLGADNSNFSFQPSFQGVTLTQPPGNVVGLTADYNYVGNWWLFSPTNVLGADPGDPARIQALVNASVPFPALSVPLGNQLAAIFASQLPMNIGCTGTGLGSCNNPLGILSGMFHLQDIAALYSPQGFTFPTVIDPITCDSSGNCNVADPNGPQVPWSGQNVKLDPLAPVTSFINSLMQTPDPSGIHTVSVTDVLNTFTGLGTALFNAYNPFVAGTECGFCQLFTGPPATSTPSLTATSIPSPTATSIPSLTATSIPSTLATSIPSLIPDSGRTFTMNVTPVAPGGNVTNNAANNNAVAGAAINGPAKAGGVLDTVPNPPKTVTSDTDQRLDSASTAVEKPKPTTTSSTNVTRNGPKAQFGQVSGNITMPGGGLATAAGAVRDQVSSTLSRVGNGSTKSPTSTAKSGNKG